MQNCSFKISVFMCKSSVHFIVPPHFWLEPPHFVWSGDGTAGSMWFISFLEYLLKLGTKNLVIRLVIWMFLPSTAFAFSCLEKKLFFLKYVVASGNADCALLFDGFPHCNPMAFNLQIPSFIVAFLRVHWWVVHYASMQFRHLLYKH